MTGLVVVVEYNDSVCWRWRNVLTDLVLFWNIVTGLEVVVVVVKHGDRVGGGKHGDRVGGCGSCGGNW